MTDTKTTARETSYLVLKLNQPNGRQPATPAGTMTPTVDAVESWQLVAGPIPAVSADKAIRIHATLNKDATDLAGSYVAVPARSWSPVTVAAQTETRLIFGKDTGSEEAPS